MATININLLPEELRPGKGGGSSFSGPQMDRAAMMPIAIGGVVALVLGATPSLANMLWLDPWAESVAGEMAEVQAEIDKYNTTLGELKTQSAREDQLKKQLTTLQSVAGVTASWGEILNELRTLTPGNLWFDTFKADSERSEISIAGGSLDYGSVAYFHRNLEASEFFVNPVLNKTEMTSGAVPTVKFDMKITVRATAEKK
jgi:Tfp pilus assembly protein PilN